MDFACKRCGALHPGIPPEPPPVVEPEKLAALRAAWLKADEKASVVAASILAEKKTLTAEELEKRGEDLGRREEAALKASLAYFGTMSPNVWRLPPTLESAKSPVGFTLRCKDGCPA